MTVVVPQYDVMIVDDDEATLDAVFELLTAEGFSARAFADARLAMESLHGGTHPRVILLDAHMPVYGGLVFLLQVLASDALKALPIVLMTGDRYVAPQPVAATLMKPFTSDALLRAIWPAVRGTPYRPN